MDAPRKYQRVWGGAAAIAWVFCSWVWGGGALGVFSYVVAPSLVIAILYLLVDVLLLKLLPWLLQRLYGSDQNAHMRLRAPKLLIPFITSIMFFVLGLVLLCRLGLWIGNHAHAWWTTGELGLDVRKLYKVFLKGFDEPKDIISRTLELYGLKSLVDDIQSAQREALGTEWRKEMGFSDQVSVSLNIIDDEMQFGMRTIKDVPLSELFPKEYACSLVKEASQLADDPNEEGPRVRFKGVEKVHPFLKVEPMRPAFGKQGPTEADTFHKQLTDQLKNFLSSCFTAGNIVEDLAPKPVREKKKYVFALTHEKWNKRANTSAEADELAQRSINNLKFRVYLIQEEKLRDLKGLVDKRIIKYDHAGIYGKHRVQMLLLLRQLYFFGNDDEDGPRAAALQRPQVKKIEQVEGRLLSESESDEWCEIEFASGVCDDRVRQSDVSFAAPRPMSRLRCAILGLWRRFAAFNPAAFNLDRIVKLERTFVEHERLIVSDMFITTHVAPEPRKIAETVKSYIDAAPGSAPQLSRASSSSEGRALLQSDTTASTAPTVRRAPARAASRRSAAEAGLEIDQNRRSGSSRRLGM